VYYRIAADAVVVIHLAFIGFVLCGGLLVFRWPRIVFVHVPAVVWAVLLELYRLPCPLTPWEQQLRLAAGEAGYSGGFIPHYLLPLIYPDGLTHNVQLVLAGVVLAVNGSVYGWLAGKRWTARGRGDAVSRSIGPALRRRWQLLSGRPGGRWLFSKGLGRVAPYTGTLGARVQLLEPGRCTVLLADRHRVRNHLRSVHAMALANLGELATGLALMNSLPDGTRGILTGFRIDYLKKARGRLLAECRCAVPPDNSRREYELTGEIRDRDEEVVAVVHARWLLGPETGA